tara:strand:- start:977 stop:1423 length:447 start_codon:yes stop_codon:yes gene_type:complete
MATNKKNEQLTVNVQYIKDLSFESPNSPEVLSRKDDTPSINVNVNVYAKPLKGNIYDVSLSINGKAERKDFKVFEIELIYAGVFTLPNIKLNDEEIKRKILIEAPQLLFPFARSIISNVTRDGGFMPLIIQPMDFELLYKSRKIEKKI